MTKSEAREQVKMIRQKLDRNYIDQASDAITNKLVARLQEKKNNHCMIYSALPGEVDMCRLPYLLPDTLIYFPRVNGQEIEIVSHSIEDSFEQGCFNVLEPIGKAMPETFEPDIIIVPGVGFDKQGNRVGYGKGFYDRLLARCHSSQTIGVCFSFQLFERFEDPSAWDIAMDVVITEKELIMR